MFFGTPVCVCLFHFESCWTQVNGILAPQIAPQQLTAELVASANLPGTSMYIFFRLRNTTGYDPAGCKHRHISLRCACYLQLHLMTPCLHIQAQRTHHVSRDFHCSIQIVVGCLVTTPATPVRVQWDSLHEIRSNEICWLAALSFIMIFDHA